MSSFHKSDATLWCPRPPSFFRLGDAWGEGGLFRQNATADTLLMPVLLLSPGVLSPLPPLPRRDASPGLAVACVRREESSLRQPAAAFFTTSLILHNAAAECRIEYVLHITPEIICGLCSPNQPAGKTYFRGFPFFKVCRFLASFLSPLGRKNKQPASTMGGNKNLDRNSCHIT